MGINYYFILYCALFSIILFKATKWKIFFTGKRTTININQLKYHAIINVIHFNLISLLLSAIAKYIKDSFCFNIYHIVISQIFIIVLLLLATGKFNARKYYEKIFCHFFTIVSMISIVTIVAIMISLIPNAFKFFSIVNPWKFFFGTSWNPTIAESDPDNAFGMLPLLFGTFYIAILSLLIAVPISINGAIYLSEYCSKKRRNILKPIIEILAAIPSIVYAYVGLVFFNPIIKNIGEFLGVATSTENSLSTAILIAIMIIPMMLSLIDDIIHTIPKSLKHSAYALGLTQYETIKYVTLPAAKPRIITIIILALSRAVGETIIVMLCAGLNAHPNINPFLSVSTFTAQFTNLLTGDDSFDSPKTLSAFALALFLILFTMLLNIIANKITKYYSSKYGT